MPTHTATPDRPVRGRETTNGATYSAADSNRSSDGTRGVREWSFTLPWALHEFGKGSITYRTDQFGEWRYFIRSRREGDPEGAAFLSKLAGYTAAPDRAALLADPLRWLDPFLVEGDPDRPPAKLPPPERVAAWVAWLRRSPDVLRYLYRERGLNAATIHRYGLGYDAGRDAITMPVYERGALVNVRRRYLDPAADPKIKGLRGRGSQLYPGVPRGRSLILAEGELDALLLRQKGLPAITSTAGTSWADEWNAHIRGRRVAVVYDTGAASLKKAERRAAELVAAGAAEAWAVDLGLPEEGDDVTDWFVTYGRSRDELRRLISAARRAA